MVQTGLIPSEIYECWGELPYFRQTATDEYHASCPRCGDAGHSSSSGEPDRFFIKTELGNPDRTRGTCRRCGYTAFALNEIRKQNRTRLDPEKIRQMREAHERAEKARLEVRQSKIAEFVHSGIWNQYHDQMAVGHRAWWEKQGVPADWQDFWKLGYLPELWTLGPAYTIPFFDLAKQPRTIQYRLANAVGSDKYRFAPDLGSAAYICRPDWGVAGRVVWLVEGAKKAMVAHLLGSGGKVQVVGIPSKNSHGGILEKLKEADEVYVILDPDAWQTSSSVGVKASTDTPLPWPIRYCKAIGSHARAVRLPVKIDDALINGMLGESELAQIMRYARSYN